MYKLKKILLFRTHSKKVKRRGRKKKYILSEDKTTSSIKNYMPNTNNKINTENSINNNSINKITQTKINKIKKEKNKKKKYGTPKNKKNKRKIGEIFIDENKQYNKNINIISSPIHKFIITKGDYNESRKKNNLNSNISINKNINIINNINNDNPILLNPNYNNINGEAGPVSFNNNYFVYTNPININNTLYNNNILKSHNNKRKIKLEFDEKNNFNSFKDISLSTPLKINETGTPNFNISETNKIFYKNEYNNILEKSAFNKPILENNNFINNNNFYSNTKTHLCFTSSIKKPIRIISEEKNNNNNDIINNSNTNNKIFGPNVENITPNKIMNNSDNNGSNGLSLKFNNNLGYNSSNKSQAGLNSSGLNIKLNNSYDVFSPDKNLTPFKASNTNLDKMFFSSLNNTKN